MTVLANFLGETQERSGTGSVFLDKGEWRLWRTLHPTDSGFVSAENTPSHNSNLSTTSNHSIQYLRPTGRENALNGNKHPWLLTALQPRNHSGWYRESVGTMGHLRWKSSMNWCRGKGSRRRQWTRMKEGENRAQEVGRGRDVIRVCVCIYMYMYIYIYICMHM